MNEEGEVIKDRLTTYCAIQHGCCILVAQDWPNSSESLSEHKPTNTGLEICSWWNNCLNRFSYALKLAEIFSRDSLGPPTSPPPSSNRIKENRHDESCTWCWGERFFVLTSSWYSTLKLPDSSPLLSHQSIQGQPKVTHCSALGFLLAAPPWCIQLPSCISFL